MVSNEEFDYSSDEENLDQPWKFDENNDISERMNVTSSPQSVETNVEVLNSKKDVKMVEESSINTRKVSRMNLNTTKAGMEGLDKEKINQIIHEASKGSRFYENEKKKEKQVQRRIEELQRKMTLLTDEQKVKAKQTMTKVARQLEQGRDLSRTIVHIDMDAFYAAVEMRDDPSLATKPMAVGGNAMLCTSNYLARRYGVRAGMPGFIAKKLCPHLTIVPTNFDKYTKISQEIQEVLAEYDQNFLPMSLDEAYLDITDYLKSIEEPEEMMNEVAIVKSREIEGGKETDTGDGRDKAQGDTFTGKHEPYKRKTKKIETSHCYFEESTKVAKVENGFDDRKYELDANDHSHEPENVSEKVAEIDRQKIKQQRDKALIASVKSETQNLQSYLDSTDGRCFGESQEDASSFKETLAINVKIFYSKVEKVVKEMRRKIEEKTQLTASAGIAPNMFLAKVCSDKNKPNGQFYLKPERDKIINFVHDLPLRKAFGIGRVSEQILTSVLKVNTCSELYDRRDLMQLLFTPNACMNYLEISLGLGSTVISVDRERKSMSTETTFREINKPEEHLAKCHELCQDLSDSLKTHGLTARKVGIKLKTVNFEVKTKVMTASFPVQDTKELFSYAKKLLLNEMQSCKPEPLRLRLMGVRAAEFCQNELAKERKQQTILSLMKKSESVQQRSAIVSVPQAAGSTRKFASEQTVDSLDHGSGASANEVCNIDDYPHTSVNIANYPPQAQAETSTSSNQHVSKEKMATFNCPVCRRDMSFTSGNSLMKMNQHVDKCLDKKAIPGMLKYDSGQENNKTKQLTTKKRKRESSSKTNKTVKCKPMDRFLTKHD